VSNSTVSHKFSNDIVRVAVYLILLSVCIPIAGVLSRTILEDEMIKVTQISTQINDIVFLEGTGQARELTEEETERLTRLEAEVVENWLRVASLDYLYTFERQVPDDIYFEMLIENTRKSLLDLQNHVRSSEKRLIRLWTMEMARLKNEN
jgi:hypothetical protein